MCTFCKKIFCGRKIGAFWFLCIKEKDNCSIIWILKIKKQARYGACFFYCITFNRIIYMS